MAKAIAPSKIIIAGEHFVVEGEPAIAAAINLYAEVVAEESYENAIRIESIDLDNRRHVIKSTLNERIIDYTGKEKTKKMLRPILRVARKMMDFVNANTGMEIYIESKIPPSAGLGSSAAVSVATAAAVMKALGFEINKELVWKAAFEAERIVHKNPSGIDITISTFGGMILYKKGEKPMLLKKSDKAIFLLAYTGKRMPTGKIVEEVLNLKRTYPEIINPLYTSAGALTLKLVDYFKNEDLLNAGRLININHELLSALGLSTFKIDLLVNIARKKGAYGAKLTGAGKGGVMYALVDKYCLEPVKEAMSKKAKMIFETSIVEEGVKAF